MQFINITGNSIYLEDIDRNIVFEEGKVEYIGKDDLLKSKAFQKLCALGAFEIVSIDGSRIEKNLQSICPKKREIENDFNKEEELMPSGTEPEVSIRGHMYEAGGYAKVNRNMILNLARRGFKVATDPSSTKRNDLNELEVRTLKSAESVVGRSAIRIDSIIPSFSAIRGGRNYKILYTTIEAASVPDRTVDICNEYNEVWVTSDFCKKVLVDSGLKRRIEVMPASVDTTLYHENHPPHEFTPKLKPFVFLSVFGWAHRKGYDALLKAYLQEFSASDPVSLLIVSRYQKSSKRSCKIKDEISKFIDKYGGDSPPHIARCSRVIPEYEMPKIYRACDAFVLPSRGEGFGLPYCESSLCGLPVIATNHSGHTMFLNKSNSTLVDIDKLRPLPEGSSHVHYWDNQLMPSLLSDGFISDLRNGMRSVYDDIEFARIKNKLLQNKIREEYSTDAVFDKMENRLREIWSDIK